MRDLICGPID